MNKETTGPFCSNGAVNQVACINNWMQFVQLAKDYIHSGDTLVKTALNDHMLLDVHVQPICFLYRHGLELLLKDLTWKSHYLLTETKIFAEKDWKELGRHRLCKLWNSAIRDAETSLGSDFPLDSTGKLQVQSFLAKIEDHDPDSYSFRYPIGKGKKRTHPQLTNVNIAALRDSVGETFDLIATVLDLVEYRLSSKQD
jgi:hypothetical protein